MRAQVELVTADSRIQRAFRFISEHEPEQTTLKHIQVIFHDEDGGDQMLFEIRSESTINFGESLRVNLERPNRPRGHFLLRVTGFYETYSSLAR